MKTTIYRKDKNISSQVFHSLRKNIADRKWLPGDRIPSENELARQFGVSRMSVRMAIQMLTALGMVEAVTGGGTYVKRFEFSNVVGNISGMLKHDISYNDINQYRALIEKAAIKMLAGQRLKDNDLLHLENCIKKLEKAAETQDPYATANADFEFHLHLCKMSGNGMFFYSYELCSSIFLEYYIAQQYDVDRFKKTTGKQFDSPEKHYMTAINQHRAILDNLKAGSIEECLAIYDEFTVML
ncbi:MAG: FadR family transcriptional regulator [Clostridiales bacterium]|nr:FadR family transcriptional regulator [Clostridiales bacterium]